MAECHVQSNFKVHFSSASSEWETPQWLFDKLTDKYGPFDLDPCASTQNAKCGIYYDRKTDGLSHPWIFPTLDSDGRMIRASRVFMNPPYGREIGKWVKKAYEESQKGALVVCLLPARTDTKWFHDYCTKGRIEFLRGRLKFGGAKNSAPFPSMVVVFGGNA